MNIVNDADPNSKQVYFDGYLPPSKKKTRLERLRAQTRRLNEYHSLNPQPCRLYIAPRHTISRNLFGEGAAGAHLKLISPPAFLVPAVIDALRNSRHLRDTVTTVPDEADIYCATYVKKHGGTVITGDSDLLVHDLGQEGAVCFFKDIQVGDLGESLRGHIYTPTDMMAQLNLYRKDGIRALAYELLQDQHSTFPKLLARTSLNAAINADPEGYRIFCDEYISLPGDSKVELCLQQNKFVQVLQNMDPRISEYVLQFPSIAKIAGHFVTATEAPHVFLPFILDWPERTSAWEMSTSVRQLAYGLINMVVPEDEQRFTAFEHRRLQTTSSGRAWQLPGLPQIPDACSSLLELLSNIREKFPKIPEKEYWVAVAVYLDVEWSSSREKLCISKEVMQQLDRLEKIPISNKQSSWAMIQFLAQVQASYYSLRILKQIISVVMAHQACAAFPKSALQLSKQLETLPTLDADTSVLQSFSDIAPAQLREVLITSNKLLGLEDTAGNLELTEESGLSKGKQRKKRRKEAPVLVKDSAKWQKRDNPFTLLDSE